MKKIILVMTLIAVMIGCSSKKAENNETKQMKKLQIGITQIVEHPSLDLIREGIIKALADNGFGEDAIDIDFKNAQGDIGSTQIIANSFKDDKKDLVIAITTPSAQAAFNSMKNIPIIYSAVTDPMGAGLIGNNITGVSDMTPVRKQFELMQELFPNLKTVGIVYNSSEQNSESQVKMAKEIAKELGIELKITSATNVNEIGMSMESILDNIDVLYTMVDNLVASAYPLIIQKTGEKNIPVIGAVEDFVKQGALATEGIDNYKVGYQTGIMAAKVLKGTNINSIEFETLEETDLIINKVILEKFNIEINNELEKKAKFI